MNKKRIILALRLFALLIGIVCTIILPPWRLVWRQIQPLPGTVQDQVEKTSRYGFDGIIVYIDRGGDPPVFYSAGWHDRENGIPARPDALFKIASINKLYDAVAITRLIGDGVLSLDDTVAEHFPELAGRLDNAESITVRMLVQHRSGIPNFTDTPGFWDHPTESSQEALELIADLPSNFEPDEAYEYSNTNYLLLAELITRTSGVHRNDYIAREILAPLELEHTFFSIHDVDITDVMSGYHAGVEGDVKSTDYGSMVATAEDVGAFIRALNDGSLFREGEKDIYSSIYVYDHTGLIPGYMSIARYHEDIDAVVIQFINTTDFGDYQHWGLSEEMYKRIVKLMKEE